MPRQCRLCRIFQKDGLFIENTPDNPGAKSFPDEFKLLQDITSGSNKTSDRTILQCPECGLCYEYTVTTPGGSIDAMITYVVEKIVPMLKHGKHHRKNLPRKPEKNAADSKMAPEFKCPQCGSLDVDCLDAVNVYGEVFITLRCRQCGNEGLLDEYQLSFWKNLQD